MIRHYFFTAIVFITFISGSISYSQPFQYGDVFMGAKGQFPNLSGIYRYSSSGTSYGVLNPVPYQTDDMAYFSNMLFASCASGVPGGTFAYDNSGNYLGTIAPYGSSIVFDSFGKLYLNNVGAFGISKYDLNGNLLSQMLPNVNIRSMDLSKDQCTMYYIISGEIPAVIHRHDICTNTPLPDFSSGITGSPVRIKAATNGEVFYADASSNGFVGRLNQSGQLAQIYREEILVNSMTDISFDPDNLTFWGASSNARSSLRFNIETSIRQSFLRVPDEPGNPVVVTSNAVKDEICAAASVNAPVLTDISVITVDAEVVVQGEVSCGVNIYTPRLPHPHVCVDKFFDLEVFGANGYITHTGSSNRLGQSSFVYNGGIIPGYDTIIVTLRANGAKDTSIVFWDQTLPVELNSFTSSVNADNIILNWTTSSEINNSEFDIERKNPASEEWIKIGNVRGSGTINSPVNYSFTDRNLSSGIYNYRLKQIDFNGNFEYYNLSNSVEIGTPVKYELKQNYPNPFNPSTLINFSVPESGNAEIKIYDVNGREVSNLMNENKEAGYYSIEFNANALPSGIYFYMLKTKNFVKTMKMMLVK